jgi:predicted RecB family nuclease
MRPYQAVPFQWSNHIESADGAVRHEEYLHTDATDPREPFARTLLVSLGHAGSICVYTGYEQNILTALADALPHLRDALLALIPRLWDLHAVVRAHYCHPGFGGSYSIKAVLPALIPALAYDDLEIRDGTMASLQYARTIETAIDLTEREQLRASLLKYCERDTRAMLEVRRALRARARG